MYGVLVGHEFLETTLNRSRSPQFISSLNKVDTDEEWLLTQTEKYCQDKAIYNAIMESIQVIDGKTDKDKGALPEILSEALAVSFDESRF